MTTSSFPTRRTDGFGWLLRDALTIAQRDIRHWMQQPTTILLTWLFPVFIALLFGGLFGGAIAVPEGSSYFEFLIPGMFTLTMLFGLGSTIGEVRLDMSRGVIDRFRSLPISGSAVVLGRCIADMLSSAIGLILLIAAGLLLGSRWHHGILPVLGGFGLLLWLRFALLWVGIFTGLNSNNSGAGSPIEYLIWPISFVSNVFVDPATMPTWVGAIAAWNPLSATGAAVRHLFGNPTFSGATESWASLYALGLAVLWPLLLIIIFLPLSARKFRNLGN